MIDTDLWLREPQWLSDPNKWPPDIVTQDTSESKAETKTTKDLFSSAVFLWKDDLDSILDKFCLRKAMRICAWISRFVHNSRNPKNKTSGPLNAEELEEQHYSWIKRARKDGDFKEEKFRLNLQEDNEASLSAEEEFRASTQCSSRTTIPTQRLMERAHFDTLHGGIGLTMAKIRENHCILRLRQLAKRVIRSCCDAKLLLTQAHHRVPFLQTVQKPATLSKSRGVISQVP